MIDFSATPAWSSIGPNPMATSGGLVSGAVQGIVAQRLLRPSQAAAYTLYAATINGGVWRCDNFVEAMLGAAAPPAIRWHPLTDQAVTLSTCALALDPLDPTGNTVWAGTGRLSSGGFGGQAAGLLKTTNGKAQTPTWAVLGATAARAGDIGLAGQRVVSVVPTALRDAATGQQLILVAALDGQGILRSKDGGVSFQAVSGPTGPLSGRATDLVADPNAPNTFYAAIAAVLQGQVPVSLGGIYRSHDGGRNWVRIDAGLPQINRSVSLKLAVFNNAAGTVASSGPTLLYAGQANTTGENNNLIGLFRCTNPAANRPQWTPLFANANPASRPNGLTASQWPAAALVPWFAMAVDPSDWNNLYLGGMSWLYRVRVTVKAGGAVATQWTNWDNGGGWDHRSLSYIANNVLIGTADPGIFGLANNANAWTSLNDSLSVTEFYATAYDETRGLVCGGAQDVGSPVQNAGGGWRQLLNGGGDGGLALVGTDGVYYYAANGAFFREGNGNVATPAGIQDVGGTRGAVVSPGAPVQLMLARGAKLFETHDQGDHVGEITPAGVIGSISALAYGANNPNAAYVGTSGGQLFMRVNGAGAPQPVPNYPGVGASVDDIAVDRTDFRKAAVIAADGRVFLTSSAGASWTNIRGNVSDVVRFMRRIELLSAGPNLVVLIGGDAAPGGAGLARTINPDTARVDPLVVWTRLGTGLPRAVVTDLRYYPAGRFANGDRRGDVLLAGTFGRGAWTIASPGTSWNTHDHGRPASTTVATAPALVTWRQPGGPVRENLFYGGANGHLIERWFNGNQWNVTDHGKPAGVAVASAPAAVTWSQAGVPIRLNVFYRGSNGNLVERWFDGNQWQVRDHGQPAGTAVASAPAAVTHRRGDQAHRGAIHARATR